MAIECYRSRYFPISSKLELLLLSKLESKGLVPLTSVDQAYPFIFSFSDEERGSVQHWIFTDSQVTIRQDAPARELVAGILKLGWRTPGAETRTHPRTQNSRTPRHESVITIPRRGKIARKLSKLQHAEDV